jgi:hypothetical protein
MMKLVEISSASARAAVVRGLIFKLFDSDATAWQCLDPNDGIANDAYPPAFQLREARGWTYGHRNL